VNTRTPVISMEGGQDLEPLSKNKNIMYSTIIPSNYCCLSCKVRKLRN